ncbi:G2/mitotic-specific cyclin [Dispira simplex]|nr:G2/mitotic-specific cyclin [Dispira simplex]
MAQAACPNCLHQHFGCRCPPVQTVTPVAAPSEVPLGHGDPKAPILHRQRSSASVTQWDSPGRHSNSTPSLLDAVSLTDPDFERNLLELEKKTMPSLENMSQQPEFQWEYRGALIDYVVSLHGQLKLGQESLYLTVNIMDRYLSTRVVYVATLQLLVVSALWLACKLEEEKRRIPRLDDLVYVCNYTYSKSDLKRMEIEILITLNHALPHPSPELFIHRQCMMRNESRMAVDVACYLSEMTLYDKAFLTFFPSTIANAALYLSQSLLGYHTASDNGHMLAPELQCIELLRHHIPRVSPNLWAKYANVRFSEASIIVGHCVGQSSPGPSSVASSRSFCSSLPSSPFTPGFCAEEVVLPSQPVTGNVQNPSTDFYEATLHPGHPSSLGGSPTATTVIWGGGPDYTSYTVSQPSGAGAFISPGASGHFQPGGIKTFSSSPNLQHGTTDHKMATYQPPVAHYLSTYNYGPALPAGSVPTPSGSVTSDATTLDPRQATASGMGTGLPYTHPPLHHGCYTGYTTASYYMPPMQSYPPSMACHPPLPPPPPSSGYTTSAPPMIPYSAPVPPHSYYYVQPVDGGHDYMANYHVVPSPYHVWPSSRSYVPLPHSGSSTHSGATIVNKPNTPTPTLLDVPPSNTGGMDGKPAYPAVSYPLPPHYQTYPYGYPPHPHCV